ncbi:hypothetical protein [Streptomyces sp. NBC_01304]|uniref:hypothetical protein n=1 Tax=Streptomyces sp. NBC_01304 TaxID=2903818 RepID=UPI002E10E9C3|nr:hypothetical protein OG430_49120 [Streptomyces sp. NBC_01304]
MAPAPVPWDELAAHTPTVKRYRAKVYERGPDECWYWLSAISSSGHGKIKAGPASRTVTSHRLGYAIEHGALQRADDVVRHTCDESSCHNPSHWIAGARVDNIRDYYRRLHRTEHALSDVRLADGRAVAIREAILTAQKTGADVEAAIAAAIAEGYPQGTLF